MNHPRRTLPHLLHWSFLVIEIFAIVTTISLAIIPFLILIIPKDIAHENESNWSDVMDLSIQIPIDSYSIQLEGQPEAAFRLGSVQASLLTNSSEAMGATLFKIRRPMVSSVIIIGILFIYICDNFRKLFKALARGEPFAAETERIAHKVGTAIIIGTIASGFLHAWLQYEAISFLSESITFQGFDAIPEPFPESGLLTFGVAGLSFHFEVGALLVGAMILALGEAFKQGRALQRESELTI